MTLKELRERVYEAERSDPLSDEKVKKFVQWLANETARQAIQERANDPEQAIAWANAALRAGADPNVVLGALEDAGLGAVLRDAS